MFVGSLCNLLYKMLKVDEVIKSNYRLNKVLIAPLMETIIIFFITIITFFYWEVKNDNTNKS